MRILLKQENTGLFVSVSGSWTDEEEQAKTFRHFLEALVFAREQLEEPVAAYCAFTDPGSNFSVPLKDQAPNCVNKDKARDASALERKSRPMQRA